MKIKRLLSIFSLMAVLATAQASPFDINLQDGFLNGANEVPPNVSPATGAEVGAGISYDPVTMKLHVNLAFGALGYTPLTGAFISAGIYNAPAGANGSAVFPLTVLTFFGPNTGIVDESLNTFTLNHAQEAELVANNFYINVLTATFPGGEIRSQLTYVPEPSTFVLAGIGAAALVAVARRKKRV